MNKVKVSPGDVFLVPLEGDDSYAAGVVIEIKALGSVLCAYYNCNVLGPSHFDINNIEESKLLSIQFTTSDQLDNGTWQVIGRIQPIDPNTYFDFETLKSNNYLGATIRGAGVIRKFLSACFGLYPWNCYYRDDYLDEMLISVDKKPNCIYFNDK